VINGGVLGRAILANADYRKRRVAATGFVAQKGKMGNCFNLLSETGRQDADGYGWQGQDFDGQFHLRVCRAVPGKRRSRHTTYQAILLMIE
jgi:hypothetical protein